MATIATKTVFMTGTNRGIGQALVEEALGRHEPGVASARSVAKAIFDGIEAGKEDVFARPHISVLRRGPARRRGQGI